MVHDLLHILTSSWRDGAEGARYEVPIAAGGAGLLLLISRLMTPVQLDRQAFSRSWFVFQCVFRRFEEERDVDSTFHEALPVSHEQLHICIQKASMM